MHVCACFSTTTVTIFTKLNVLRGMNDDDISSYWDLQIPHYDSLTGGTKWRNKTKVADELTCELSYSWRPDWKIPL